MHISLEIMQTTLKDGEDNRRKSQHLSLLSDKIDDFPALSYPKRYSNLRTLQHSLFGCVKTASDAITSSLVCIKISDKILIAEKKNKSGVEVLEDVRREARILKYLHSQPNDHDSKYDMNGRINIVGFHSELEDSSFHYLITEHCGRDLFFLLKQLPPPIDSEEEEEDEAESDNEDNTSSNVALSLSDHDHIERLRGLSEFDSYCIFLQLLSAVSYLHSRHVCHSDLSIENICITKEGIVKLIDFGLARIHPLAKEAQNINLTSFKRLNPNFTLPLPYSSPFNFPSIPTSSPDLLPCSLFPFAVPLGRPGKTQYMSPEVYSHLPSDSYSSDIYSLGVILYTLLVQRPPYFKPCDTDSWYCLMINGEWCSRERKNKGIGKIVYGWLSDSVCQLINGMMKKEDKRWKIKQLWEAKWMEEMEEIKKKKKQNSTDNQQIINNNNYIPNSNPSNKTLAKNQNAELLPITHIINVSILDCHGVPMQDLIGTEGKGREVNRRD